MSTEFCEGCGHVISWHYHDVRGIARCRAEFDNSYSDGFPCDCADFKSEIKARRNAKEALEREERNRAVEEIKKGVEAALADAGQPKLCTTSGKPITDETREIDPRTGMQKDYIVLCPDERAKGFVRPVRRSYSHLKCGVVTTMGQALAETYARDPFFYSGTFCCGCGSHFPVGMDGEFVWSGSTEKVGT